MGGRFEGGNIIVTGGTGGLGRAVSLAFLQEGAKVAVTYIHQHELDALKQAAAGDASKLSAYEVDVTNDAAAKGFITRISDNGRIDALVNAVGGYAGGSPLWEADEKALDHMLALNLKSGYALSRAVVPLMRKQARGAIVNIVAKAAIDPPAGAGAYAASKAAALALMESLAADLKGSGVRVNCILPSIIDTEANRKSMPKADFSRWPKPEDIASVILFLCSDEARVIQGAAIPVYGDS
ncbi:MAG TPA: SDR family oxidoreductase [Burkholderiales bacterium]|nr:SDR family oxidoreductase [Burkholderiales bacterium]